MNLRSRGIRRITLLLLSITGILYCFQFCIVNKDANLKETPVVTMYSTQEPLNLRVVNRESMGKFSVETSYFNALAQYENFAAAPSNRHLKDIQAIAFKHRTFTYFDQLHIIIDVSYNGAIFPGCTFKAQQTFRQHGEERISLCSIEDFFNGTYRIVCTKPGVPCVGIHVKLLFCYNTIIKWKHDLSVIKDIFCFEDLVKLSPTPPPLKKAGKIVSWSKDKHGHCKNLYIDNILQRKFTANETRSCMARYDNVYLVGTSHIAQFGDYLMRTCTGIDMRGIEPGLKHGNMDVGNLHFRDGRYSELLYAVVKNELNIWLSKGSKVAIWFQTGSWDYIHVNVSYSIDIALDCYEKAIIYTKSTAAKHKNSTVDLHIIASPPRPAHTANIRMAEISAFDAKLQLIAERHNVSFINEFAVVEPCRNDNAQLHNNHHHYLQRDNNTFGGPVGMAFYLGVFLPTVCQT